MRSLLPPSCFFTYKRRPGEKTSLTAVVLTACSTSTEPITVDELTAPTTTTRVPRVTDNSDRPQITFDPCLDIPDDVLTDFGYKATAKDEFEMPYGTYSFLGCGYTGTELIQGTQQFTLNILAGNVTFEEELDVHEKYATRVSINGRDGALELDPETEGKCAFVLQTDFGIVKYSRIYHKDGRTPIPIEHWCDGMTDFVTALEPYIEP